MPGRRLDRDGARAYVRENLAAFKVPRDVAIVAGLSRNATGMVVKRALYP